MDETYDPNAAFAGIVEGNDPLIQAMIAAGLFDDKTAANSAALAMSHKNAQTQQPQGQQVGRAYVAASPLEHMAAAMRMARGEIGQSRALAEQQRLIAEKGRGLGARITLGAQRPVFQEPTQPVQGPQPIGEDESIPYYLRRPY